jgi:5-methylcytosine-specific restriction protein A
MWKDDMGFSTQDFKRALDGRLRAAAASGVDHLDVNAGQLHRWLGDYLQSDHRMPACCAAMRSAMRTGDVVLAEPPKGTGASLTIRYRLPRS